MKKCSECDKTLSKSNKRRLYCSDRCGYVFKTRLKKAGKWKTQSAIIYPPTPTKLTSEQKEVLIGGLLGDFFLHKVSSTGKSSIQVSRTASDIDYLRYQFEIFRPFCGASIREYQRKYCRVATSEPANEVAFATRASEVFASFRDKWYPKGKKIVPTDLKLTPLICAIWFCDDGSVCTYTKKKNRLRIQLAVNCFSKREVEFLAQLLAKTIGGDFRIYTARKGRNGRYQWRIFAYHDAAVKFIDYIKEAMPKSMSRKSDVWERHFEKFGRGLDKPYKKRTPSKSLIAA